MALRRAIAAWAFGAPVEQAEGAKPAREAKAAGYGGGTLLFSGGGFGAPERSYEALAASGFMRNPVAYRCVRLVAEPAAAVPLLLYDGAREIEAHPILDLLRRPNAAADGVALVETLAGHLVLAGNAYLEAVRLEERVRALHVLRPDRVRVIDGPDGWPAAFEYRAGTSVRRIAAEDEGGGAPAVLHLKLFHPLSDAAGFAPLGAAADALSLHNAASRWNQALLDNSARPSGALVYRPADGSNLSPDQFERLRAELDGNYAGMERAGRPMLLDGGLDWKAMALSPKEMDFMEAKNGAARDIALAFGVPPMLLGVPGDATYANYGEANRAFLRSTVLPLVNRLAAALGNWLASLHGAPHLRLGFDADRIEGLAAEREALWARLGAASFLDEDEKREAVGYGPRGSRAATAKGEGDRE